jgi:type IV pilus assembly protein PilB
VRGSEWTEPPEEGSSTSFIATPDREGEARGADAVTSDGNGGLDAEALIQFAGVTEEQVRRAERIRGRMESPLPLGEMLVQQEILTADELKKAKSRRMARMSVVEILLERGQLTEGAHKAYTTAKSANPPPPDRDVLVGSNLVPEEEYLKALGVKLDIPFVEPQVGEVDTRLYDKIGFAYLLKHKVMPVRVEDGELQVVVARPEDDALIGEVERTFGRRAIRMCSTEHRITEALRTLERLKGTPSDSSSFKVQYREIDRGPQQGPEEGEEAIQLVDYLLGRAVQVGASDLHIEPSLNKIRVRVRVDGVLQQLTDLPIDFNARVTARIKILAGMDVTEKRNHQDGKIHIKLDGNEIDIRVSTYVSVFGETIVMRLLHRDKGILPLEKVGFQPRAFAALTEEILKASSGMVLMVGPTGSGKTTTLYSFIDHANDPTEKVITCEDPVEYVIDGIIQCSVNAEVGRSFPDSLRAIVRQDPDTIIVGEIRDQITASLAVESALTGHKVFSTFHTEEAVGAFVRILEMGIEPFLVASTVTAVVAQRLLRVLCPECKVPHRPTGPELRFLELEPSDLRGIELFGPGGCEACNSSGFKGRVAIHEVLIPDDEFREAVLEQSAATRLREMARLLPEFLTMQEDGVLKALSGVTTLSEVIENAPRDRTPRPIPEMKAISQNRRRR